MIETTPQEFPTIAIDATAKRLPEFIEDDGLFDMQDVIWDTPERLAEVNKWLGTLWKELKEEILKVTGEEIPDFDPKYVRWVQYNDNESRSSRLGDHSPMSGVVRLNGSRGWTEAKVARTLAHELLHMACVRKLLQRDKITTPVRTGLAFIGHSLIGKKEFMADYSSKGWSEGLATAESLEFKKWSLSILDEALIEITSQRILDSVAKKVPRIENEHFEPDSYPEARRFYKTLVHNLVLAWNNPELRSKTIHKMVFEETPAWKALHAEDRPDRLIKLKAELGFGDTITEAEVEHLFEQTLFGKDSVNKVARLINTMLGEQAFQEMYRITSGMNASTMKGGDPYPLWKLITEPAEKEAAQLEDTQIPFAGNKTVEIKKDEIPSQVIIKSLERVDGLYLGIIDIFKEYEKLMQTPNPKEDVLTAAVLARRVVGKSAREYPFHQTVIHEERRTDAFQTMQQESMNFCFKQLLKTLQVSKEPVATVEKNILENNFEIQYYEIPNQSDLQLAKVKITEDEKSVSYYFFVK